jgi:hypothetical protein
MTHVQQLYSRLQEAAFLLERLKQITDDALAEDK